MGELKTVEVSAELDREHMYEVGEKLGMEDKALSMFRHFNWVTVKLIVDMETGLVKQHSSYGQY